MTSYPKDPFNGNEVGTSLFLTGGMGPKISEKMDGYAKKAGMSRRNFIKSSLGFSAAMLAANEITGMKFFEVGEAEAADVGAKNEAIQVARASSDFIVDVHTHVCTRPGHYQLGVNTTERGMWFVQLLDDLGKAFGLPNGTRDMNVENYGKLILQESDTTVGIFNPFGFREDYGGQDMIPMEYQVGVRNNWPKSTLMLAGGLTPNQGLSETLDRLTQYVEKYKISGLKLYTFDATEKKGWWFDDEKLAYPIWEKCRKLGIKNIGCHKGIPFGQFYARYAHAEDFDAAADDFLDLNFIAYHSAWPYHNELAALKGFKPQRKNLYCEVGSTFAATVTSRPLECAHVIGTLLARPRSGLRAVGHRLAAVGQPAMADRGVPQVPDSRPAGRRPRLSEDHRRNPSQGLRRECSAHLEHRQAGRRCRRKPRSWRTRPVWPDRQGCIFDGADSIAESALFSPGKHKAGESKCQPTNMHAIPVASSTRRATGSMIRVRSIARSASGDLRKVLSAPSLNTRNHSSPDRGQVRKAVGKRRDRQGEGTAEDL